MRGKHWRKISYNSIERQIARKIDHLRRQNKERRRRYLEVDVKITNLKMMLNRRLEERKWKKVQNLPGVNHQPTESLE